MTIQLLLLISTWLDFIGRIRYYEPTFADYSSIDRCLHTAINRSPLLAVQNFVQKAAVKRETTSARSLKRVSLDITYVPAIRTPVCRTVDYNGQVKIQNLQSMCPVRVIKSISRVYFSNLFVSSRRIVPINFPPLCVFANT